eukprot:346374-Hanusia_phi.AAC.1
MRLKGASGKVYRAMMKETKEEVETLDDMPADFTMSATNCLKILQQVSLGAISSSTNDSSSVQVASGLAAIHSAGVCHGDLYAHNIMADTATGPRPLPRISLISRLTGWAQILDFGASFLFEKDAKDPLIDGERVQRKSLFEQILELAGHVENGNEGEGKEILDLLKRTAQVRGEALKSRTFLIFNGQECLDTTVMSRPSASTIARRLHASPKVSS